MLADDLIAYVTDRDRQAALPPPLRQSYAEVARRVSEAPRFILQRDAVMTVQSIGESAPSRFLTALDVCRLPFPSMWVEFAFADRSAWLEEAARRGITVVSKDGASPPSRLGFLMEQEDTAGRVIMMQPVWVHHHPSYEVSICNAALRIDTRGDAPPPDAKQAAALQRGLSEGEEAGWHSWKRDPREMEAAVLLENRFKFHIPDHMTKMWAALTARGSKEMIDKLISMARYDLASEWRFALALLTMLNSRNVMDIGPESDLSKLNKARIKKGAPPLLTHREIRLSLSKVQKNRIGAVSGGQGFRDAQAHIVRGHYKLRASGLYWWNPHVRGATGEVPHPKTYRVDA